MSATPSQRPKAGPAGLFKNSMAAFLAALVMVFVTAPFLEELPNGYYLEALLVLAVLVTAVLAVGGRRKSRAAALVLSLPILVGLALQYHKAEGAPYKIYMGEFLLFTSFVIYHLLRFILRAPRVNSEVLCAGIATYLLLGLLWAAAYALMARLVPDSFSGLSGDHRTLRGFNALYFSVITLTTVGYGDILPTSGPARMLAMIEALTGTLYMAVLVARLVSVYATGDPAPPDSQNPDCNPRA